MSYKIEPGIPVPLRKDGAVFKYPFAEMKAGDSFFIPAADASAKAVGMAAFCYARYYAKDGETPMKFTVRTLKDKSGCRCWRLS